MSYLEIKELTKTFKKRNKKVLNGINLNIEKGEIAVILGPSGNGKTTLCRILNGLETYDTGEILLEGEKLDTLENDKFSLIFQSFNLFPQYTALENTLLALNNKTKKEIKKIPLINRRNELKLRKEENNKTALNLLEKMDLIDKKDCYPHELSGGQMQRVAIARALALKPDILCFDEPTSALDPKTTLEIVKCIKELKTNGYTELIITHDINFAKEVADKVYFLKKGLIKESGTVDEIINSPKSLELIDFLGSKEE